MPTNGETFGGDSVVLLAPKVFSGNESLPAERCRDIHLIMARTRALEERMIKMSKSGQGYFWIGGPGEEAFNHCLGFRSKRARGRPTIFCISIIEIAPRSWRWECRWWTASAKWR